MGRAGKYPGGGETLRRPRALGTARGSPHRLSPSRCAAPGGAAPSFLILILPTSFPAPSARALLGVSNAGSRIPPDEPAGSQYSAGTPKSHFLDHTAQSMGQPGARRAGDIGLSVPPDPRIGGGGGGGVPRARSDGGCSPPLQVLGRFPRLHSHSSHGLPGRSDRPVGETETGIQKPRFPGQLVRTVRRRQRCSPVPAASGAARAAGGTGGRSGHLGAALLAGPTPHPERSVRPRLWGRCARLWLVTVAVADGGGTPV